MATYCHIDYVFTTVFVKSSAIAEKMIGNDWWLFGDKIQRQVEIETYVNLVRVGPTKVLIDPLPQWFLNTGLWTVSLLPKFLEILIWGFQNNI